MKLKVKILALILAALAAFGAVGCSDISQTFDELKCAHDYGETPTSLVRKASCKETGIEEWTCTKCNKKKQVSLERLSHTVVIDVAAVAATSIAPGTTEGKHCSVCNEVLSTATELAQLDLDMEALPKVTFRRNTDDTLTVMMRFCMPVADMNAIRDDVGYEGIVLLTTENYSKHGAVTEESVFGSHATYTRVNSSATALNDALSDAKCIVREWNAYDDTATFLSPFAAGSWILHPDAANLYERLTTEYLAIGYLKVGSKRIFATSPTYGLTFYDGIRKAYSDGAGWNYDFPNDEAKKIMFTKSEKEWLYNTFIQPVNDA